MKKRKRTKPPKKKRRRKRKQTLPWTLRRELLLLPLRTSPKVLRRQKQTCCEIRKQRVPTQLSWNKWLLIRLQQKKGWVRKKKRLRLHGEQYLTPRKNQAKHIGK